MSATMLMIAAEQYEGNGFHFVSFDRQMHVSWWDFKDHLQISRQISSELSNFYSTVK